MILKVRAKLSRSSIEKRRIYQMRKILFTFAALLLLISVKSVAACSCIKPDPSKTLTQQVSEAYKNSKAVFSANVLSLKEDSEKGEIRVKLRLIKPWKGKLGKTLTLVTGLGGGDCGYFFEVGKTYLIYAYRDEDKRLTTNICSRTAGIVLNQDAAILNKLKK